MLLLCSVQDAPLCDIWCVFKTGTEAFHGTSIDIPGSLSECASLCRATFGQMARHQISGALVLRGRALDIIMPHPIPKEEDVPDTVRDSRSLAV